METEYYRRPDYEHVFQYYDAFREKEGFGRTPVDLREVYNKYAQDYPQFIGDIPSFGTFFYWLYCTNANYMEEYHRHVNRIHNHPFSGIPERKDIWERYCTPPRTPCEHRDNPVISLLKPHSNEHDSGDNIPEPDEFELFNAASYRDRINAWERQEELRRR
jgi:hypothetical protein